VPLLIPLSWFVMAVPSYAIARRLVASTRFARSAWSRIGVASLVLLSWHLALDPAMSHATKYWVWGISATAAPYYGMPWSNLFGWYVTWYVTGLALMAILSVLRADAWVADLPIGWLGGSPR
jgi:putative membrane protein